MYGDSTSTYIPRSGCTPINTSPTCRPTTEKEPGDPADPIDGEVEECTVRYDTDP